jgi:hypothetical protein|tara:strand:- start:433 stop:582 length:150 start_codon:yes stop_codon:yes gene_type:complete
VPVDVVVPECPHGWQACSAITKLFCGQVERHVEVEITENWEEEQVLRHV